MELVRGFLMVVAAGVVLFILWGCATSFMLLGSGWQP